jgi:glycosyltransferase involved in cell wall biosynthesis
MRRILLAGFCAVPGPRRSGVQLRHVVRALAGAHVVELLVTREGEQAYHERRGAVRVLRVPSGDGGHREQINAYQRALRRQLDGADYDVVHCRDAWSGAVVLEARARLGVAMTYDLSRAPLGGEAWEPELAAAHARLEEQCLREADLVLAPTALAARGLAAPRGGRGLVWVAPLGVDVDRFDWDDPPEGAPPRVVYVGAVDGGRGLGLLLRAAAPALRELDATLVLAGPIAASYAPRLAEAIAAEGLAAHVELPGAIDHDQLPALLATATVCVVPGGAEAAGPALALCPTKLYEYLACKRAVVAPRRPSVAAAVEHGREALLFEPDDPVDLARKLSRVLGEPALRERLAAAGYERVRREFTASAARRAVRQAYAALGARLSERAGERTSSSAISTGDAAQASSQGDAFDDLEAMLDPATAPRGGDTAVSPHVEEPTADRLATAPVEADETLERPPVEPAGPPSRRRVVRPHPDTAEVLAGHDDGTPSDGVRTAVAERGLDHGLVQAEFVAGEIDVPTPPPGPPPTRR